ncbi:MAG TPA: contact-dependent growth inhibition system immunity protein [Vicinamibacterales bacterium]|jgi:hypothetical protein
MTPGARRRGRRRVFSAREVPALAGFARAYLHEDVLIEHGSALDAVRAFHRDATTQEQTALAADFTKLIAAAADWPAEVITKWFREDLGAAWAPGSFDDLVELGAAAARAPRRAT